MLLEMFLVLIGIFVVLSWIGHFRKDHIIGILNAMFLLLIAIGLFGSPIVFNVGTTIEYNETTHQEYDPDYEQIVNVTEGEKEERVVLTDTYSEGSVGFSWLLGMFFAGLAIYLMLREGLYLATKKKHR